MSLFRDAPLTDYVIHNIDENENEYNYYLFVHPRGPAIIMRINQELTEIRFAKAGYSDKSWDNRETLPYITYDKLN